MSKSDLILSCCRQKIKRLLMRSLLASFFSLPFSMVSLLRPTPSNSPLSPFSLFLRPSLYSVGASVWRQQFLLVWKDESGILKIAGESQGRDYKYKFELKGHCHLLSCLWLLAQEEYRLNALQLQKKTLTSIKNILWDKLKENVPKGSEHWGVVIFNKQLKNTKFALPFNLHFFKYKDICYFSTLHRGKLILTILWCVKGVTVSYT